MTSLDPNDYGDDGPTEFSWGAGIFPPGIADGEGQRRAQDDFGDNMIPRTAPIGDADDIYARAVADRRTDPTDPESNRDFECAGNPDRFGANPPLIRSEPQINVPETDFQVVNSPLERKW
jgi:hypothetical protein